LSLELKPYREYKDSGLPWLGEVPAHWRLQRIKHAFKEASWRELHGDEVLLSLTRSRGLIPHSEASDKLPSAEDLNKYKVYKPGELVMNRMQAWSGMFGTAEIGGLVSPDYSVFEPTSGTEVNFFKTLFMTPLYTEQFAQRSQGIGSGFNRLYTLDFGAIPIATPPPEEQRMIARFLGSHDRLLNCLIRAKQRLIELLNEQKQAIIHRAVTRGLDPDAPTKLTDLDWLPEVPEHWDVAQLGRFITLQRGIDITKDVQTEGSIPVVSSGGIHSHHNKSTSTGPGVLVGRKGSVGSVYFVESDYWAHDTTLWVKKFGGNDPKFVY
jgi:type I restriction enzyme S subunit